MRKIWLLLALSLAAPMGLPSACSPQQDSRDTLVETESARLNAWFAQRFEESLARSPMSQTAFGQTTNYAALDDISQLALDETAALQQIWLDEMRSKFDIDRLDDQTKLSFRLYEFDAEDNLASHAYAEKDYVFQHMNGPHSDLPSFMINQHHIKTADEARAYIETARRRGLLCCAA